MLYSSCQNLYYLSLKICLYEGAAIGRKGGMGGGGEQKYSKPVRIMSLIRKKGGRDKT